MINTILVMSATATALTLFLMLFRPILSKKIEARARVIAWCIVLLASLIPMRFSLAVKTTPTIPTVREVIENVSHPNLELLILSIWVSGMAVFLIYGIMSYVRFTRKLSASCDQEGETTYLTIRKRIKTIKIYSSNIIDSPILHGIIHPKIFIPHNITHNNEELSLVLLHELAHHRRYDIPIRWIAFIANAIHWFNPALYLLRRELFRESELAADATVMQQLSRNTHMKYGKVLLDFTERKLSCDVSMPIMLFSHISALGERILAIVKYKEKTRLSIFLSWALIVITLIAAVSCSTKRTPSETNENDISDLTYSIRIVNLDRSYAVYTDINTKELSAEYVSELLKDADLTTGVYTGVIIAE